MNEQRKKKQSPALRTHAISNDISPKLGHSRNKTNSKSSPCSSNKLMKNGNFQRQPSYDSVRKIVQEEGRTARNLVTWNVPVEDDTKETRPPTNQHESQRKAPRTRSTSNSSKEKLPRDRTNSPSVKKSPPDTASELGTPRQVAKKDLRNRYWAFLFDNLRRAVDEIYNTCETDESVVECKEAIMMLEQSTRDFHALIERLQLLRAYENADETNRPKALAWDVRKTSPGKALSSSQNKEFFTPSPTVSRALNFAPPPQKPAGSSFAERVKNSPKLSATAPATDSRVTPLLSTENTGPVDSGPAEPLIEDSEGWETVPKGRHGKHRRANSNEPSSPATKTLTSPHLLDPQNKSTHHNTRPGSGRAGSGTPSPRGQAAGRSGGRGAASQGGDAAARQRACSIDSEKENTPLVLQAAASAAAQALTSQLAAKSMPDINRCNREEAPGASVPGTALLSQPTQQATELAIPNSQVPNLNLNAAEANAVSPGEETLEKLRVPTSEEDKIAEVDESVDPDVEAIENAYASALDAEAQLDAQLEQENEAALRAAADEEEDYLKQIAQEESGEIEVDTETEIDLGTTAVSGCLESSGGQLDSSGGQLDWEALARQRDQELSSRPSWGDLVEEEEVNTRTPGRCVRVHEKLASPSRKSRSVTETRKKYEEKQAKAEELRNKLMAERQDRVKLLTVKVEEVRTLKEMLMQEKRQIMSHKLAMAEEKRLQALRKVARKAHEEENKANEIAFINSLEAQNKKHDLIQKQQELEARLQDREEERKKKVEEEAAKKAAVEARRRGIEAEKMARLHEILAKRQEREKVLSEKQQEKEKERIEQKRAREKEFEERVAAMNAHEAQRVEELQRQIQQKLDNSERRYLENIAQKKEKAFEMSILRHSTDDHNEAPTAVPYEIKKYCSVCRVMISSEVFLLSHLRGKKHLQALKDSKHGNELTKGDIEQFNLAHIADAPSDAPDPQVLVDRERQRALKKRCKKLRTRMAQRGSEFESSVSSKPQPVDSEHRARLQKAVKDLNKYVGCEDKGPWPQNRASALDRTLGELARILEKKNTADQCALRLCGGLATLTRLLLVINDATEHLPTVIPARSLVQACAVFRLACRYCYDNCHYVLFSNEVGCLVDMLFHRLEFMIPENFPSQMRAAAAAQSNSVAPGNSAAARLPHDMVATALLQLLVTVLSCLARQHPSSSCASAERTTGTDAFASRTYDVVSYLISVGVVDKLSVYFDSVRGPLADSGEEAAEFVQHGLGLLISATRILAMRSNNIFAVRNKKREDPTQLITTFQVTDLCGLVSLLYGILLHSGSPTRGEARTPPELPAPTLAVLVAGFKLLNQLATLDLPLLQSTLGGEGLSLEFRHIASYLLWYCNKPQPSEELLHEVILSVGYFTLLHADNQSVIQSGQPPTVLQQLCQLPFQYFSDPRLTAVLFPTLMASCYQCPQNRAILQQELSCALLATFIEEKLLEQQELRSPGNKKGKPAVEKDTDPRMSLAARFPQQHWAAAQHQFTHDISRDFIQARDL